MLAFTSPPDRHRGFFGGALRALLIASVVVLFALWLAAPPMSRAGDAPGLVCDSFGRGGRTCSPSRL